MRAFRYAVSYDMNTVSTAELVFDDSVSICSASAASHAAGGADIIGIDLGTTNSCVAVMEGKVETAVDSNSALLHTCTLTRSIQACGC